MGAALVTALARLGGRAVAIVANNPAAGARAVDAPAVQKAARFLSVADAFHLPVADNLGVLPGSASERTGALRHAARMFAVPDQPSRAQASCHAAQGVRLRKFAHGDEPLRWADDQPGSLGGHPPGDILP